MVRGLRGRARGGHRDRQDRIGAQLALIRCAVEVDHCVIDGALLFRLHSGNGGRNFLGDVLRGLACTFAEVTLLIVITKLDGFMLARGGAGRNGGAADCAIGKAYVGFNGRIAPRIENLAANHLDDFHIFSLQHT